MKKFISRFLAIALLVTMLPITALASTNEQMSDGFQNPWQFEFEDQLTEISRIDFVDRNGNPLMRSGLVAHEDIADMFLTSEIVYVDENGGRVVARHFTDAAGLRTARNVSGTKTHRVEISRTWATNQVQKRWASGSFTYNSSANTVTVSNAAGGVNDISGVTVSNKRTTTGSGTTFILGLGRAWREVSFTFDTTNAAGLKSSWSVRSRVHSNGNS